jgi:hypothetical protein
MQGLLDQSPEDNLVHPILLGQSSHFHQRFRRHLPGILVIDYRDAYLFWLKYGHAELKRQFLQWIYLSRDIELGVNTDYSFIAFGQSPESSFAEGSLPYQDDTHSYQFLITSERGACGYRPSHCPV